jgi:hypothetical protein
MHVDLSFSYLRSAATASFDRKELRRNCTPGMVEMQAKKRVAIVFLAQKLLLRIYCTVNGLKS